MRASTFALALGLAVAMSQLTCAQVQSGNWPDGGDVTVGDGGADGPDGGPWQCYTGTAMNEAQFFNHCTDAEHIDRASHIPSSTWDGKSPLP